MSDEPHDDDESWDYTATVLFDNGVSRVETHEYYGAIVRGGVAVEHVFGRLAFVPADRDSEDEVIIPNDIGELG